MAGRAPAHAAPVINGLIDSGRLFRGTRIQPRREVIASGLPELDAFLPFHGFDAGGITELVGNGPKYSVACTTMALHSRSGRTAWLSSGGILNPHHLAAAGAKLLHCHFLVEPDRPRLSWCVQQALASALFRPVFFHAGRTGDGPLLPDPLTCRKFLGLTRRHRIPLVILLDDGSHAGSTCSLRLEILEDPASPAGTEGEMLSAMVRVVRCNGASPGREMRLRCGKWS